MRNMKTRLEILQIIKETITRETGLAEAEIDDSASFHSLGLDSIRAVVILDNLERRLGIEMSPLLFWDYPTVGMLVDHLTSASTHD